MKIIRKLALMTAPIIMLALPFVVPSAPANAVACNTGNTCYWPGFNFTGTPSILPNSGSGGVWFYLCNVGTCSPGSVIENGSSTVWLWSRQAHISECLEPITSDANTDHAYGWSYIEYGKTHCGTIPAGAPQ
jgi:hypothetical protein